ncbi:MAG: hypothetical protein JWO36_3085 [Myxococcales bacterium]|nr:hypothetical protein [Myxococcales bacterium]
MRLAYFLIAVLSLAACADPSPDDAADGEALTAADQPVGKEDAASFAGLYHSHATTFRDGDVPSLDLIVNAHPALPITNAYVRSRCYHGGCSRNVPETDAYSIYTSTAGRTYVRFWSVSLTFDPDGNIVEQPVIADVYEIKTFSHGIKLRKSYSTVWQSLYTSSPSLVCHDSHGTWAGNACTCPGNTPGAFATREFIAGAGGCIATPGANESNCDGSHGAWTDDESTLIGSFCRCGLGRYDDANGSCAAI